MALPDLRAAGPARLFLALWPGAGARRGLQAWQAALRWPAGARPTPADQLHLTLHFIGAVPRERLPQLTHALARAFTPFVLHLGRFTLWRGGIAVLLADDTPPALAALHAGLADALQELGLPVDARPFRPHVTLARHAAGATLAEGADPAPVAWQADAGYVLAESAGGYRVLAHFGQD